MSLSNTTISLDLEHQGGVVIEVGFTLINLAERKVIKSYSIPIKCGDIEISGRITELTGWTAAKLNKQGIAIENLESRLDKYGFQNRLIIVDSSNEIDTLLLNLTPWSNGYSIRNRFNVSDYFKLKTGIFTNLSLDDMLGHVGLPFEGRKHSAKDDSLNIGRLFLKLMYGVSIV